MHARISIYEAQKKYLRVLLADGRGGGASVGIGSREQNLRRGILDLERRLHVIFAGGGRRSASGIKAVDFLKAAGCAVLGKEFQPRHGPEANIVLAERGAMRRRLRVVLPTGHLAKLHGRGVEVEESRRGGQEEVVATNVEAGGQQGRLRRGVQVELQSQAGENIKDIGVGRGDAAGVEQRRHGADRGGGRRSIGTAGVVLRPAANGHVLEREASGRRGKRRGA